MVGQSVAAMTTGDSCPPLNQPLTYQRLCDRVNKLGDDNTLLREQVDALTVEILELKLVIELNTSHIKRFSDTFIPETASLKSNLESVIEQLDGL